MKQGLLILFFYTLVGGAFAQQAGTVKGTAPPSAAALTKGQAVRPDPQAKLLKDLRGAVHDLQTAVDSLAAEISQLQEEARSYRNKPADILGVVATTITVLVGLLAIVLGTGVAMAIAIFNQWGRIRKLAQEDVERTRKAADEAQEVAKAVERLQESLEKDARAFAEQVKIPAPGEEMTPEVQDQFRELHRRLELVEAFGGNLGADGYAGHGMYLYYSGKHDLALEALNKAIELETDYTSVWAFRAAVHVAKENRAEAIADLTRAIEIDDSYREVAKKAEEFKTIRDTPEFKKLVE